VRRRGPRDAPTPRFLKLGGGDERVEGEAFGFGQTAVRLGGGDGDAVAAGAEAHRQAEVGEDVAVGAEGGEDGVHGVRRTRAHD
jgi:hypothetical protein